MSGPYLVEKVSNALPAMLTCLVIISGCGFHWVTEKGRVREVIVCDETNCDARSLRPTHAVTLHIHVDRAPFGTRVRSHWYYIESPGQRRLLRERMADLDAPQCVVHRLEPPKAGFWKPGEYLVEVSVQDRVVAARRFWMSPVKAPSAPDAGMEAAPGTGRDILDDDF